MKKICALQMDAIETININADSTFVLGLEALKRGYDLYHYQVEDLFYEDGEVFAFMRPLSLQREQENHFTWLGEVVRMNLKDTDVVWLRQDPPFDMGYITNTHLLDLVKGHTKVVNDPTAIRNAPEKLLVTQFQDLCAPTLISRNAEVIKEFREKHKDIIIKPLYGNGGAGVFMLRQDDANLCSLLEMFFASNNEPVIAQKFISGVGRGDKRILLINGEAKACINRIPAKGEARANLHVGGKFAPSDITDREREICTRIGGYLRDNGLLFVGIDVIDGYLTEINVTSPTCIQEANSMYDMCLQSDIWDSIEVS